MGRLRGPWLLCRRPGAKGRRRRALPRPDPRPLPRLRLCALQGGLDKKRLHYIEGGQAGNRQEYINNLVRAMN